MAEAWLSTVEKLTEFLSSDQIEASARRTKFVQRASKITGKLFLALVTFGRWSSARTTVAQLAAKAAHLDAPVDITPAGLQQRMTERAVAFLREVLQTAFAKLHTVGTVCEDGLFAAFGRVHIVDSTGFGLPASLQAQFPGAGGSGSKAGGKIQLVWDYKSQTFEHFALLPWNVPDNKYVETVVALAQPHSLFLFDLGYFKLAAFAKIAAAQAYFLSRFQHQTTLREVTGNRTQVLDLAQCLSQDSRGLVEKGVILGTHDPQLKFLPVIILTTSTRPEDITRCYKLGANAYFEKPIGLDSLFALLRTTVEFWSGCKFRTRAHKHWLA